MHTSGCLAKRWYIAPVIAIVLSILWIATAGFAQAPGAIQPAGYVTDVAGVISGETKAQLNALCNEVEQKTGAQIAIVTIKSLEGNSIENYAVDLYKHFGVGAKSDNRGVLLLVAPGEHKYRIEVGYGLEPVINDARAGDAGRAMVPLLRQSDYSAAIQAATEMLAKYIADDRGVTLSGLPHARRAQPRHDTSIHLGLWPILILIWIIFSILRATRGAGTGRRRRGGWGSGGWWIGPIGGGWGGGGGFGGSSGGFSGGGGFGGFGGGSSGGGGASGSW